MSGKKKGNRGKTLHKTPKGYKNEYGVWFSDAEKKKLESKVNSANRKRKRLLEFEKNLPAVFAGRELGVPNEELMKMGKESDMVLHSKSKSLNKFRNRKEFNMYMKMLDKVTARDYIDKRVSQYKENHIKAIMKEFSFSPKSRHEVADMIHSIRTMSTQQYLRAVQNDEAMEIWHVYEPTAKRARLNQLKKAVSYAANKR